MRVQLLGTGNAPGWPQPFCCCASCLAAQAAGEIRAHTSALVDGRLLLDCGQDVPRSAVRLGVALDGVRQLLVTHDHHDHAAGSTLLWRAWAGRREPLQVLGPPAALDALRPWLHPTEPGVGFRALFAGDLVDLDGYLVRALAAVHDSDGALLYDVTAPDGHRLLYATDTGPGFDPPPDARYDLVLLEESWGDRPLDGTGDPPRHHDLASFPLTLAALRRAGAVDEATRVVAVHLGHGNPAPAELRARLATWGAQLLPDGAILDDADGPPAALPAVRRTLLLGGARSGKSRQAERLLAAEPEVWYVATADPAGARDDAEWAARVATHRARRPAHWHTLETLELAELLRTHPAGGPPLLVDCLTLWLTGVFDRSDAWTGASGEADVESAITELVDAWRATRARVVAVSNEVGSGVVPDHPSGRRFRDRLGQLNAAVAAQSDQVLLVTAGIARDLKESP